MDKQHVKGAARKLTGAVKDVAGRATGSLRLQAAGKADKAEGAARMMAGDVKDAGRRVAKALRP